MPSSVSLYLVVPIGPGIYLKEESFGIPSLWFPGWRALPYTEAGSSEGQIPSAVGSSGPRGLILHPTGSGECGAGPLAGGLCSFSVSAPRCSRSAPRRRCTWQGQWVAAPPAGCRGLRGKVRPAVPPAPRDPGNRDPGPGVRAPPGRSASPFRLPPAGGSSGLRSGARRAAQAGPGSACTTPSRRARAAEAEGRGRLRRL